MALNCYASPGVFERRPGHDSIVAVRGWDVAVVALEVQTAHVFVVALAFLFCLLSHLVRLSVGALVTCPRLLQP